MATFEADPRQDRVHVQTVLETARALLDQLRFASCQFQLAPPQQAASQHEVAYLVKELKRHDALASSLHHVRLPNFLTIPNRPAVVSLPWLALGLVDESSHAWFLVRLMRAGSQPV